MAPAEPLKTRTFSQARDAPKSKNMYIEYWNPNNTYSTWQSEGKSPITLNVFYPYLRGDLIQPQLNPFGNFESSHLFLQLLLTNRGCPRCKKNNTTSAQGSTNPGPGVANVELPADVEVSRHEHSAAPTVGVAVLAAREAQHGARLHEAVFPQTDAGTVQGPPQGDHRKVSVEADGLVEAKAVLQEERDASRGIFCGQDGQT